MFFIFGISPGEKKLNFEQKIICSCCGRFGMLEVIMVYMYFSLFFIPIIKWNKRYFAIATCCHSRCEIDRELGRKIAKGEVSEINQNDLHFAHQCNASKHCGFCGFETDQDFQYCPKCGKPF